MRFRWNWALQPLHDSKKGTACLPISPDSFISGGRFVALFQFVNLHATQGILPPRFQFIR